MFLLYTKKERDFNNFKAAYKKYTKEGVEYNESKQLDNILFYTVYLRSISVQRKKRADQFYPRKAFLRSTSVQRKKRLASLNRGKYRKTYDTISYFLSSKHQHPKNNKGWPVLPKENIGRLTKAKKPVDRTVPKYNNCNQLGYISKFCLK